MWAWVKLEPIFITVLFVMIPQPMVQEVLAVLTHACGHRSTEFERLAQVGAHASSLSLISSTICSSFAHFLHRSLAPLHQFGILLTVGDPCIAGFLLS